MEMREEMSRLKSERLVKETQISRMEMSVSEKADQINELQRQLRQVSVTFMSMVLHLHFCYVWPRISRCWNMPCRDCLQFPIDLT